MKASNRIRIGHALVAGFAFLAVTLGNSAAVRAQITNVATFSSTATNDYTYSGGGSTGPSTLTATTSPLNGAVSYGVGFFTPNSPASDAATISLSGVQSSTAAAGINQSGWSGSYTITDTVTGNVLKVTIDSGTLTFLGAGVTATLSGVATFSDGGGSAAWGAALATITQPESFSFSLAGATLTGVGSTFGFANFNASDVNVNVGNLVPEPSTMAIAGLGALGMIGYGIRRRKGA